MSYKLSAKIDSEKINIKMAQIQAAIRYNMITYQNDTNWIIQKFGNINYQVVATNYLQLEQADWIGNTALHFAAEEENLEAFNILLNHDADFTIKNRNGLTALHLTMQELAYSTSLVHKLDNPFIHSVLSAHLKYNNFANPSNDNGLSHFHIACAANNVEAVKGFLQSEVYIDHAVKTDSALFPGYTSVHFVVKYSAFEVARLLLSHGVNLHIKDAKGLTALHLALAKKLEMINDADSNETLRDTNDKILLLLLSKSNDDAIRTDDWGLSDFHVSCALKDAKIAECLFLHKVVNINHAVNIDSPLWPGYSALHFAALCNIDTVKVLMKNGADIDAKDAKGVTPFEMCLENCETQDISEIISLNASWKNIMLSDGKTKLSDLFFAMRDLNQLGEFLSKVSIYINIPKDSALWPGCSPLHLAVIFAKKDVEASEDSETSSLKMIKFLHRRNSHMLYSQDVHGYTPLHLAFRLNKKPVLDLLMEFTKESVDLDDHIAEDGLSFAHIASAQNDDYTLRQLWTLNVYSVYKGKSQFSPLICQGSTPLHFAVANGSEKAIDVLIKFGADVYAKDANNMTPIHLLLFSKNVTNKMIDILLSTTNLKNSVVYGIGLSHLHIAGIANSKFVQQLLDDGADPNAQIIHRKNIDTEPNTLSLLEPFVGHSPLIFAYKNCRNLNVELLLEHNADMFVEYTKGISLLYHVLEDNDNNFRNDFLKTVRSNENLMARVNAETGMTSLHLACFDLDMDLIEKSLSEGANVNTQIRQDSPILQGYTPLHILFYASKYYIFGNVIKAVELLLKAGADVTLQNAKSETAIHLAYKTFYDDTEDEDRYRLVNRLLETQQDFSINPINVEGISHFLIACNFCNVEIAKKLLIYGDVDVNQQTDHLNFDNKAGYSALHLAVLSGEEFCGISRQLDTIDMLLNHGANVNTEDHYGNTPFHYCTRYMYIDHFERLARTGGDVNSRNIRGITPMYYYLMTKEDLAEELNEESEQEPNKISLEGIKTMIRFGCRINNYCTLTHVGYLGKIIDVLPYEDVKKLFSLLPVNFKREMEMDDLGRTAIHNIVSFAPPDITAIQYIELIRELSRIGCDIDDQDNLGRTALHLAVKFYNFKAISGLLLLGADVNIHDSEGKTALVGDFDACDVCEDKDEEEKRKCHCIESLKALATYVRKLQRCGLDVNKQNQDLTFNAFKNHRRETSLTDEFLKEFETVENIKIEPHALTLYDFLSEYGDVIHYPRMSEEKRRDIKKFFSSNNAQKLREQFPELAGILQLQYRKARARSNLVQQAGNTLTIYAGFRLPDICSHYILVSLKHSELKNLIASISSTESVK